MTKKILIVEDDPEIAEAVEGVLLSANYEVAHAATAAGALPYEGDDTLDLVLLDLRLPDGDGGDILEKFKKTQPELPVVMMTGVNEVQRAVDCMKAGAQDYLRKPFARQDLLETVSTEITRAENGPEAKEVLAFEVEEKRIIEQALNATKWRVNEAAQKLRIGRATIYRKIERYGLERPRVGPE